MKQRIIVDKAVKRVIANTITRDDLLRINGLRGPRDNSVLDQINDSVGNQIGMDAEILTISEILKSLIWDSAEADLKGRAVLNHSGDILCNLRSELIVE